MQPFAAIAREIGALTGARCEGGPEQRVTGGSINECYRWVSAAGAMFVKVAAAEALAMFEAEAAGLAARAGPRAWLGPSAQRPRRAAARVRGSAPRRAPPGGLAPARGSLGRQLARELGR